MFWLAAMILIAAVATYLRVGAVTNTVIDAPIRADAAEYYFYAYNLSRHGVYSKTPVGQGRPVPDAVRSPGYPLFLAPLVSWPPTDHMLLNINLLQALLGVGTVLITFSLCLRFMPRGPAILAALFTAISPHLVSFTAYLLSETLFTFLLVLTLWLITGIQAERRHYLFAFASGLLLAAAALTRPAMDYFMIPLAGLLVFQFGPRQGIRLALACLAGFAALSLPWALRNLLTLGQLSDPTLMTNTLLHGMYPNFTHAGDAQSRGFPYRFDPRAAQLSRDMGSVLGEIGRRFHERPLAYLKWYVLGKPVALFSWDMVQGMGDVFVYPVIRSPYRTEPFFRITHAIMQLLHWPLVGLSAVTAVLAWVPRCVRTFGETAVFTVRLLSLLLAYYVLVHMVGAPFPRYSVLLRPVTYALAVFGLFAGYCYLATGTGRPVPGSD